MKLTPRTYHWGRYFRQSTRQPRLPTRRGTGGGELCSLFVPMILAIVTSRRGKRATSRSFRKWCPCYFQMPLLKFLDIEASLDASK